MALKPSLFVKICKRIFFSVLAISVAGTGTLSVFAFSDFGPVLIASSESKTVEGATVFNQIQFISAGGSDIWMLNQSHHGVASMAERWDRLAIVVDRNERTARFFQLEPGPLKWTGMAQEVSFRVSCFMCHNNGPRAVRPIWDSFEAPLGLKERAVIATWNLRVKSYGRLKVAPEHDSRDAAGQSPPFRSHAPIDNDTLKVAACVKCHREDGVFSRGLLKRQQMVTISHMVESGQMPPPGFSLSDLERSELQDFLAGL
ncbi:MAG: hypothetical protein ABL958_19240 [Bdellovibrionia bacterium]